MGFHKPKERGGVGKHTPGAIRASRWEKGKEEKREKIEERIVEKHRHKP
jgi:hypothetical protein